MNVGRRIPSPSESPDALPKDFGGMLTSVRAELTSHQYKVCKFQMYMYMLHITLYSVAAISMRICILCGVSHMYACTFSECTMHIHLHVHVHLVMSSRGALCTVHACTLTMDSIVQKAARCSQPAESILFILTF